MKCQHNLICYYQQTFELGKIGDVILKKIPTDFSRKEHDFEIGPTGTKDPCAGNN